MFFVPWWDENAALYTGPRHRHICYKTGFSLDGFLSALQQTCETASATTVCPILTMDVQEHGELYAFVLYLKVSV